MKEKTVTTYICDFCGKEYAERDSAIKCESSHDLEERLELIKDSVICPTCKGQGWYWGNDGCDSRTCYACNGKGIIIPVIETRKVYKRIGE